MSLTRLSATTMASWPNRPKSTTCASLLKPHQKVDNPVLTSSLSAWRARPTTCSCPTTRTSTRATRRTWKITCACAQTESSTPFVILPSTPDATSTLLIHPSTRVARTSSRTASTTCTQSPASALASGRISAARYHWMWSSRWIANRLMLQASSIWLKMLKSDTLTVMW